MNGPTALEGSQEVSTSSRVIVAQRSLQDNETHIYWFDITLDSKHQKGNQYDTCGSPHVVFLAALSSCQQVSRCQGPSNSLDFELNWLWLLTKSTMVKWLEIWEKGMLMLERRMHSYLGVAHFQKKKETKQYCQDWDAITAVRSIIHSEGFSGGLQCGVTFLQDLFIGVWKILQMYEDCLEVRTVFWILWEKWGLNIA